MNNELAGREKLAAYSAWAAVCFFWGTTYLAIRIGLETFPPMLFAGVRFLTAGVVLFLVMSRQRNVRLPTGREWFDLGVVGLLLLGVGNGIVVLAEQWISSGTAALLIATSPFWVTGLERTQKGGERVGLRALTGMLIGFAGLALLIAPQLFGASVSGYFVLGVVGLQVGCLAWSAGSMYSKRRPSGVAPLMAAAVQMLYAGVALTLVGTFVGEWGAVRVSARSLGALAYLIVFGSIVAYGSYIYAIRKLPLALVTTYSYINPIIAVLLGWLLLSEPLGWRVLLAATTILLGVALVKTSPQEVLEVVSRWRSKSASETEDAAGTESEEAATLQDACKQS